jgi:hypothetical protein
MDQVHLVMHSTRNGYDVEEAFEDELDALRLAGTSPLRVVRSMPVTPSSSRSAEDGASGPAPPPASTAQTASG